MNTSEILAFLKAPFKQRYLFACLLSMPILLATPLIFSFFKFIYTHLPESSASFSDERAVELLYSWAMAQDMQIFASAFVGVLLASILAAGYHFMLGHTIVSQGGEVFNFQPVNLTGKQACEGALKGISYALWTAAYVLFCVLGMAGLAFALAFLAHILPTLPAILIWIILVLAELAILFWMLLNMWVSGFRFLIRMKTRVCFQWVENYQFLKKYKGKFFLILGLGIAFSWGSQLIMKFFYSTILKLGLFLESMLLAFNAPQPNVVIVLGLLIWVFVMTYIGLLQTNFTAKCLVWLDAKAQNVEVTKKTATIKKVTKSKKKK